MCTMKNLFYLCIVAATVFGVCTHLQATSNSSQSQALAQLTSNDAQQSTLDDQALKKQLPQSLYQRLAKEIWFGAGTASMLTIMLAWATLKKMYAQSEHQPAQPQPLSQATQESPSRTVHSLEITIQNEREAAEAARVQQEHDAAAQREHDLQMQHEREAAEAAVQREREATAQREREQHEREQREHDLQMQHAREAAEAAAERERVATAERERVATAQQKTGGIRGFFKKWLRF